MGVDIIYSHRTDNNGVQVPPPQPAQPQNVPPPHGPPHGPPPHGPPHGGFGPGQWGAPFRGP